MIYTIFFRKLQKNFGVAIQSTPPPRESKGVCPTQRYRQGIDENDNKNKNDYHYHSKNVGNNHFQFFGKCGIGICVGICGGMLWYEIVCRQAIIILGIKHQASRTPLCPSPPPLGVVFLPHDTICHWWWCMGQYLYWWYGGIVVVSYAVGEILSGHFYFFEIFHRG